MRKRRLSHPLKVLLGVPLVFLCGLAVFVGVDRGQELRAMRGHPLIQAVYRNDLDSVRRLLASGADACDAFPDPAWEDVPRSALLIACEGGDVRMVRLLLDHGAQQDINVSDGWGNTPLSGAVDNGHQAIVNLLVERGAHGIRH